MWRHCWSGSRRSRRAKNLGRERELQSQDLGLCGHACIALPYHLCFIFTLWLESRSCHPNCLWSSCAISPASKQWAAKGLPLPTAHRICSLLEEKFAFWKSWRLHSLFSKYYISRQWVSSKLWEHLTQSGFMTFLNWEMGKPQWSMENRSLLTQNSFSCLWPWAETGANSEHFSRGVSGQLFPPCVECFICVGLA